MFGRLFKRKSADSKRGGYSASTPEDMRIYAIGDVHGRLDLLRDLVDKINEDAQSAGSASIKVVFLGDYVDRGMDSCGVINLLIEDPFPNFDTIYLKGNHEQAILDFLKDPAFGTTWKYYGGLETLHSYGLTEALAATTAEDFVDVAQEFRDVLPEQHVSFLSNLPTKATIGDYCFVHAGMRPGIPLDRQVDEDMLWIRDTFLSSKHDFGKIIVHGHTPTETPVLARNRIGIDTGAYMTGVLTALVLEGEDYRFLQTGHAAREANGETRVKIKAIG